MEVADKSSDMIETGNLIDRIIAKVSSPVPHPASSIFAPRLTGNG
jgi:hypothetical protein